MRILSRLSEVLRQYGDCLRSCADPEHTFGTALIRQWPGNSHCLIQSRISRLVFNSLTTSSSRGVLLEFGVRLSISASDLGVLCRVEDG